MILNSKHILTAERCQVLLRHQLPRGDVHRRLVPDSRALEAVGGDVEVVRLGVHVHDKVPRASAAPDVPPQGCQMAKFDPFLSLDCARVEGVGAQSKERKGSNFDIWQP